MKEVKVIALVGMPGAGKSSGVEHLEKKSWPSVYFGGITLDEIKIRGLDVNAENEKMVREDIRLKEGKDAYAKRIIEKIKRLADEGHNVVVADGLYSWTEYKAFKEAFSDNAVIIAIATNRNLRHDRLANRATRPLSDSEVTSREYAEIENIEKGGPIANADYTILNNGEVDELHTQLDKVLAEVGL